MGSDGQIGGTYTYSNGTAALTPNSWSAGNLSGGTATASGDKITIVINWIADVPQTFKNLTKQ
jgi:hypothetical protein